MTGYFSMRQAAAYLGKGDHKDPGEAVRTYCRRAGVPLSYCGRSCIVLKVSLDEAIKRDTRTARVKRGRAA